MNDTLASFEDEFDWGDSSGTEPRAIGDVLEELFTQYRARFPEVNITVVEVPTAA